jgi:hypothetical protein
MVTGLLLLAGTLACAFFVYGVTGLLGSGPLWVDVPAMVGGAIVALFALLLLAGVLYRIDRIRGVVRRRIELFE